MMRKQGLALDQSLSRSSEHRFGRLGAAFGKICSNSSPLREQALCDARAQIFRVAVRGVKDTIPDGFAAIKLSGLGRLGGMDHG